MFVLLPEGLLNIKKTCQYYCVFKINLSLINYKHSTKLNQGNESYSVSREKMRTISFRIMDFRLLYSFRIVEQYWLPTLQK